MEPTGADGRQQAAHDALADLRERCQHACLHAFVTRDSPEVRFALSLRFTLDPAAYPQELLPELGRAQRIILADPSRYERILRSCQDDHPDPSDPSPADPPGPNAE